VLCRLGPYAIVQCSRCLLAWTEGAAVEPEHFYDESYFDSVENDKGYNDYFSLASAMGRTSRARLRRLRRLVPGARTLLDAGCGPGFFVKHATDAGLDACGLEVSEFAARVGRERLDQRIVAGPIDDEHLTQVGGPFDLITLWDAIEHLHAPDEALRSLAERLAPGGVLALSTGDITALVARFSGPHWHLYNLPEHLWFFSVQALKRLLRRAGLEVVDVQREVCWYTAQYLIDRLAASLCRRPVPLPRPEILQRLSVPITLLDIVTLHARKPGAG